MGNAHRFSIFSQSFDRSAFVAYFLGAIVPLGALAVVSHYYVLPQLEGETWSTGVMAALVGVGALSLVSFLALRRTARQAIARTDADNRRLAALLDTAGALATVGHRGDAGETISDCARRLGRSEAAWVLVSDEKGSGLDVVGHAGAEAEALYPTLGIEPLCRLAIDQRHPVLRGQDPGGMAGGRPLAILPIGLGEGALALVRSTRDGAFEQSEIDSLSTLAGLGGVALQNADLHDNQRNFFAHVTDILVGAMNNVLDHTEGHPLRTAHVANRLARELGLSEEKLERLHFAALLHDVGMLKIPVSQHENPRVVRTHCVVGYRMLSSISVWHDIAPMVLYHHEWWNGEGYPEGLSKTDIPFESRIIAVADAFDSMTNGGSYRDPISIAEAVGRIDDCSGTQFDPDVARAINALLSRGDLDE